MKTKPLHSHVATLNPSDPTTSATSGHQRNIRTQQGHPLPQPGTRQGLHRDQRGQGVDHLLLSEVDARNSRCALQGGDHQRARDGREEVAEEHRAVEDECISRHRSSWTRRV